MNTSVVKTGSSFQRVSYVVLGLVVLGLVVALVVMAVKKNTDDKKPAPTAMRMRAQARDSVPAVPAQGAVQAGAGSMPNEVANYPGGNAMNPVPAGPPPGDFQPAPLAFSPYSFNLASAYESAYPQQESNASLTVGPAPYQTNNAAYQLNLDSLMPSSWRVTSCPETSDQEGEWSKYAPSKAAFSRYQAAAGSARLSVNTRVKNPTGGVPLLLRASPPVPMAAKEIPFNDSSFRNDLIYNATGFYPQSTAC